MLSTRLIMAGVLAAASLVLSGCVSDPKMPPPKEKVTYIDTNSFDRSLNSSLSANLERVEILVDDKISPIAIPERLNKWLAAVDANGGSVQVKQVEVDSAGKTRGFPIALIGLAIELIRLLRADTEEKRYESAGNYDAEVLVRQVSGGERVIERVILYRREAK